MATRTSGGFLFDNLMDMVKDQAFQESYYSVNILYIPINSSMNGKTEWLQLIVTIYVPQKIRTLQC